MLDEFCLGTIERVMIVAKTCKPLSGNYDLGVMRSYRAGFDQNLTKTIVAYWAVTGGF
jgi:hypothetical protein